MYQEEVMPAHSSRKMQTRKRDRIRSSSSSSSPDKKMETKRINTRISNPIDRDQHHQKESSRSRNVAIAGQPHASVDRGIGRGVSFHR
jgi:hypothetical protein